MLFPACGFYLSALFNRLFNRRRNFQYNCLQFLNWTRDITMELCRQCGLYKSRHRGSHLCLLFFLCLFWLLMNVDAFFFATLSCKWTVLQNVCSRSVLKMDYSKCVATFNIRCLRQNMLSWALHSKTWWWIFWDKFHICRWIFGVGCHKAAPSSICHVTPFGWCHTVLARNAGRRCVLGSQLGCRWWLGAQQMRWAGQCGRRVVSTEWCLQQNTRGESATGEMGLRIHYQNSSGGGDANAHGKWKFAAHFVESSSWKELTFHVFFVRWQWH